MDDPGLRPALVRRVVEAERRAAGLTVNTFRAMADALDVTADVVGGPDAHTTPLRALGRTECVAKVMEGGVGRVIVPARHGPHVVLVNYKFSRGAFVFRSSTGGTLAAADGREVAFEVDRLDEDAHAGWSVLAHGRLERLRDPAERAEAEELGIEPWAGGRRSAHLRIRPDRWSGREITPATTT
jgi:hypothetical protein